MRQNRALLKQFYHRWGHDRNPAILIRIALTVNDKGETPIMEIDTDLHLEGTLQEKEGVVRIVGDELIMSQR